MPQETISPTEQAARRYRYESILLDLYNDAIQEEEESSFVSRSWLCYQEYRVERALLYLNSLVE